MGGIFSGCRKQNNHERYKDKDGTCQPVSAQAAIRIIPEQVHQDIITKIASMRSHFVLPSKQPLIKDEEMDITLSCSDDKTIVRFNWSTDSILDRWEGHQHCVNSIEWSAQMELAVSCSRDKSIRLWKPNQTYAVRSLLDAHSLNIAAITMNYDASVICSGGRDNEFKVWDLETGKLKASKEIQRNIINCLRWIPGSNTVLQGGEDLILRIWDTRTCSVAHEFDRQNEFPLSCDVNNEGDQFITSYNGFEGSGCQIKVWDPRKKEFVRECIGHQEAVRSCTFLPSFSSYKMCASVSKDETVRVWNLDTGTAVAQGSILNSSYLTSIDALPISSRSGLKKSTMVVGSAKGFLSMWELSNTTREGEAEQDYFLTCTTKTRSLKQLGQKTSEHDDAPN